MDPCNNTDEPEKRVLTERIHTDKAAHCVMPFTGYSGKRKAIKVENVSVTANTWGLGSDCFKENLQETSSGDKNVSYLDGGHGYTTAHLCHNLSSTPRHGDFYSV